MSLAPLPIMQDIYAEHRRGDDLRQVTITRLMQAGVPPVALTRTRHGLHDMVLQDRAVFLPRRCFEFERYARGGDPTSVLTVVARDGWGDITDIVAWEPETGRVARWLGRAALLGEHEVFPRLGEPLPVFSDPTLWLQAERCGVVVLDVKGAAPVLREAEPLIANGADEQCSIQLGDELQRALAVRAPRILVPSFADKAAA